MTFINFFISAIGFFLKSQLQIKVYCLSFRLLITYHTTYKHVIKVIVTVTSQA